MAAALPNSKHEKFAKHIAGGVKQRDAYARAGYAATNNRAAASRLAKKVASRVNELRNEEAASMAEEQGMKVVMNRCPKIEYSRLFGELGWNGINTGVIFNRRRRI